MTTWMISGTLGFIAGVAADYYGREPLMRWWKGAEKFARDLEEQARALRQRLR